jgi:hypothetical protein
MIRSAFKRRVIREWRLRVRMVILYKRDEENKYRMKLLLREERVVREERRERKESSVSEVGMSIEGEDVIRVES